MPAALDQEGLDDAVLERMERHHHQPAAGLEHGFGGRQGGRQLGELLVDEDAQRLERAGRRMNGARPRPHHALDDVGERPRGADRRFAARRDDGAGDGAGVALLAERLDDVGEIALGRRRDHIGGGRAGVAHAHVERTVEPEREAALGLVELHRGDAEIETTPSTSAWP